MRFIHSRLFTAAHDLLQSALLTALPKSTLLSLRSAFLSQIPPSFLKFRPLPLLTTSVRRRPSWLDVYGPHEITGILCILSHDFIIRAMIFPHGFGERVLFQVFPWSISFRTARPLRHALIHEEQRSHGSLQLDMPAAISLLLLDVFFTQIFKIKHGTSPR